MTGFGIGFFEMLLALLMGGASLGGAPLGLPPGELDPELPRTPPEGCLVYVDWASRGTGQPGAAGVDGLAADPEVLALVADVKQAFRIGFDQNIPDPQGRAAANTVFDLTLSLLQRPGCLFVSCSMADLPPRGDDPNFAPLFERLRGGLVLSAGDDADAIQEHLTDLFALGRMELPPELDRYQLPLPLPGGGLTLHRDGERFIACYGRETLETILAGLSKERDGLLADQRVMTVWKGIAVQRPAQRAWVDVGQLVQVIDHIAGGQAKVAETVQTLGLDAVQHFAAITGVDDADGRITTRLQVATNESRTGLMSMYAGRPLQPRDLAHIPADADFVVAESLDHARMLRAVRTIIETTGGDRLEQFDAGIAMAEQILGVSIERDLLPGYGGVWSLYDAPSNGGLLATASVLCLEVADHDIASRTFLKLMETLEHSLPGEQVRGGQRTRGVFLASHPFSVGNTKHVIAFINTVGDDVPVAPAFCLTKTHLLVALHPQALKGHLRFVHDQPRQSSLELEADHPVTTRSLIYFRKLDTPAAMRYLTAASPYLTQLFVSELQSERVAIDLFSLPSARALLPYVSTSVGWVEVQPTGLRMESTGGVPIPGVGGVPTLFLSLFGVRSGPLQMLR